ncbi:MAG: HAD hydrolase-like protein [Actinomycetota bacterium]
MRAPTTHVLIDLDGTISNSEPGIGRSLIHAFTECGYPAPDGETIRSLIGPPFELSFPTVGIDVHDVPDVIAAYRRRYDDAGWLENEIYDGVPEMLDGLRSAGHTLSIATAKPEALAHRILDHFELSHHFAVRAGASELPGSDRRTKGEVIAHALDQLRVGRHDRIALDHVIMLGDRNHDVEGAHLHGIDCIGVSWGFGSNEELDEAGVRMIVDHPRDVVAGVAAIYRSREP